MLCIILFAPMLLERMRIPSVVGMIAAGVIIGPHGTGVLSYDSSFELFGKVGIYYIMFLASLEMNLHEVSRIRGKALLFGLLTFACPMLIGLGVNTAMGYGLAAAILMAAMYASHTLIAYPQVMRYGLSRLQSVNLAVGGTIVADTLTLLVLAVIAGLFQPDAGQWEWAWLLGKVVSIGLGILLVVPRICRYFFRLYNDVVVQFVGVLALVFLGAGLMEWVGMDGILGAFLTGIALNRNIPPSSPLMNQIGFVGNALFIPYFLIGVGMTVDIGSFVHDPKCCLLALAMIATCCVGKWLAALLTGVCFGYGRSERRLIFGLTSARAAATLAIVLAGHSIVLPSGAPLFGDEVVGAAMALILVTCSVSSLTTESAARAMVLGGNMPQPERSETGRILVALGNPDMVDAVMGTALVMRTPHELSPLAALHIVLEDNAALRKRGHDILDKAGRIALGAGVKLTTQCRWSVNSVTGITHSARELEATDVLIGMHHKVKASESLLGTFTMDLMAALPQQIIVCRTLVPVSTVRHLHLVAPRKGEFDPGFSAWTERVAYLAEQICCRMTVYSGKETLRRIEETWRQKGHKLQAEYVDYLEWHDFLPLSRRMRQDHIAVFILAREGLPSRHNYMAHLPEQIERYFSMRSVTVIMPPQAGL